jgi:hypothetical protein
MNIPWWGELIVGVLLYAMGFATGTARGALKSQQALMAMFLRQGAPPVIPPLAAPRGGNASEYQGKRDAE